jgi:hypothetical protein
LLPIKTIFKLYSEFDVVKNYTKDDIDYSNEAGLPVQDYMEKEIELKEKHPKTSAAIMTALGYRSENKNTIVDWEAFLKV